MFQKEEVWELDKALGTVECVIDDKMRIDLIVEIGEDDIKRVVFQLGADMALDPNGYNRVFYQT